MTWPGVIRAATRARANTSRSASWDRKSFRGYLATPPGRKGPGILLCQEIFGINDHIREIADQYAEEGYFVLAPDLFHRLEPNVELGYGEEDLKKAFGFYQRFDEDKAARDIKSAVGVLRKVKGCNGKVAALGYCLGGKLAYLAASRAGVDAAIGYYGVGIENNLKEAKKIKVPLLLHFAGNDRFVPPSAVAKIRKGLAKLPEFESYVYPGTDHAFNCKERPSYDRPASGMAYSRSIAFLRRHLGPRYDLSTLWDLHTMYEFGTRDVEATMKTMVASPYVNHIPTMTGGVGAAQLARFYRNHFIPKTPKDTKLIPISRTVGADRVVDEMLFCFTHDIEIDWMLPGPGAHRQICRDPAGGHRQFPRPQALSRAYLLGSGLGAGADRASRFRPICRSPGWRRRGSSSTRPCPPIR